MAKLQKYNRKNKLQSINLKNIYTKLSCSPDPLLVLMSKHYGLEFHKIGKRYICTQHSGIKIEPVKRDQLVYTLNNYSNALNIKGGQIKAQLFNLTTNLTGENRVLKQVEILTNCGLIDENLTTNQVLSSNFATSSHFLSKTNKSYTKNKKSSKKPVFVNYNTPYGNKVFSYVNKKTGASLKTLLKYGVFATTSKDEIRYSYQVGSAIKSKFPFRKIKEGKFSVFNHSSQYVFGLDQLPSKGKVLILASGEDDTLCINQNLNKYGVFAICSWNETTCIPKAVANDLLKRFERCFILGDNDNAQTTKKSFEIADKTGFMWINTSNARAFFKMPNNWDICDIYQDSKKLHKFILFCIGSNAKINSYKDDPDSFKIPHCYQLNFSQYIGQQTPNKYGIIPTQFIHHQIEMYDRLIIESLAGTGKSTLLTLLVHQNEQDNKRLSKELVTPNLKELKKLGVKRVIILEPTTAINAQLPEAFKERGLAVASVDGFSDQSDVYTALNSSVILVCYDSLHKIKHLIEDSLLIVDEFHQLPIDMNFRSKEAFRSVIDGLEKAKKVLLLSATSNRFFALSKKIDKSFGYKIIKGIQSVQNEIPTTAIIYEGNRKDIPYYIVENAPQNKGVVTTKFDSKKNLNHINKSLTNRGVKSDFFHSGDKQQKEGNLNYQSLMKTGLLKEDLSFLWYTTLMEAGVSIKNQVALNCLVDVESWQKFIQLVSRARYNQKTGVNEIHPVWIFRSSSSLEKESQYNGTPVLKEFDRIKNKALNISALKNDPQIMDGQQSFKTETDKDDPELITRFNKETGLYEPCILGILRTLYLKETKAPLSMLLKRANRFDSRIKIQEDRQIKIGENEEIKQIREAYKTNVNDAKDKFENLLKSEFNKVGQAICYSIPNQSIRNEIRDTLKLKPTPKKQIIQFIEESKGAFQGKEPNRIIKDVCFYVKNSGLTATNAVEKVLNLTKSEIKSDKSQIQRKLRYQTLKRNNFTSEQHLSAKDMIQIAREFAITKEINLIRSDNKRGKGKEWRTPKEIQKVINRAIAKINKQEGDLFSFISERKAMTTIKDLYNVESRKFQKDKKRIWKYKILEQKTTLKDA